MCGDEYNFGGESMQDNPAYRQELPRRQKTPS